MNITIGVVAYNEEESIYASLKSIIDAVEICDELFEIIVVASGCSDNTVYEAQKALSNFENHIIAIENERRGKASAINKLVSLASGQILILCDADVLVDKKSIYILKEAFKSDPELAVASARLSVLSGKSRVLTWVGRLSAQALDDYRQLKNNEGVWMICGHLYVIRTVFWDDIPEDIVADDAFIGLRALKQGRKLTYVRNAVVFICYPQTWTDYFSQRLRNRYARRQLAEKSAELNQPVRWLGLNLIKINGFSSIKYFPVIVLDCLIVFIAEIGWIFSFRQNNLWKKIKSSKQIQNR